MGHRNREIEKKFEARDPSLLKVSKYIRKLLKSDICRIVKDQSRDYYWNPPLGTNANFIRLRFMPDGSGQLTLKHNDKNTNIDRVEIDVDVSNPGQCKKYHDYLYGKPAGSIFKRYHVYFLDENETSVSVYQVTGDRRVFVEIEAQSLKKVEQIEERIRTAILMDAENRSLYQIFIKKGK